MHMCGVQPVLELDAIKMWQEGCMQRELALAAATKSATEGAIELHG